MLEDYDGSGDPRQINVYKYGGGYGGNELLEIVSYDLTGLDTGAYKSAARKVDTEDGGSFMGGYSQVDISALTADRIISRVVYSGSKGSEKIDYILSGYDEDNVPGEVTVYDYSKTGGAKDRKSVV